MEKNGAVSLGEWIVTMLLMLIPIVNLVLLVIWGFGGNANESKANWAKATLVFIVISFVLSLIMGSALTSMLASMGRG